MYERAYVSTSVCMYASMYVLRDADGPCSVRKITLHNTESPQDLSPPNHKDRNPNVGT